MEDAHGRQGRGVNQSELHRQLEAKYGIRAPALVSVSKWLRTRQPPAPEFLEAWASAFDVRAAWLYFNDGPMVAEVDHLEAFHQEQAEKYPPHDAARPTQNKGRRAG